MCTTIAKVSFFLCDSTIVKNRDWWRDRGEDQVVEQYGLLWKAGQHLRALLCPAPTFDARRSFLSVTGVSLTNRRKPSSSSSSSSCFPLSRRHNPCCLSSTLSLIFFCCCCWFSFASSQPFPSLSLSLSLSPHSLFFIVILRLPLLLLFVSFLDHSMRLFWSSLFFVLSMYFWFLAGSRIGPEEREREREKDRDHGAETLKCYFTTAFTYSFVCLWNVFEFFFNNFFKKEKK